MNGLVDIGLLQTLLNAEATLSNLGDSDGLPRKQVSFQIEKLRDPVAPSCYGHDDCSTHILSMCPWRMTCGDTNDSV